MNVLEINIEAKQEQQWFPIGQVFKWHHHYYMLCCVDKGTGQLINIVTGNRWSSVLYPLEFKEANLYGVVEISEFIPVKVVIKEL